MIRFEKLVLATLLSVFALTSSVSAQTTAQSVNNEGILAGAYSGASSLSSDGRFVVFESNATNLSSGDFNNARDIFIRDRNLSTTEKISVDSNEALSDSHSYNPVVSDDGRYVVFWSAAENLITGDNNEKADVFIRDRTAGTTNRVSVSDEEAESNGPSWLPSINSGTLRYVTFLSYATNLTNNAINGKTQVFRRDLQTGETKAISVNSSNDAGTGNSSGHKAPMSSDGDIVAFGSNASNLTSGDTNKAADIFVRVVTAGTTSRVSVNSAGVQGNKNSFRPSISSNGRYVAFESSATNLVANDTNRVSDIFLHDRNTSLTRRVSVGKDGIQSNGASGNARLSGDGRYVVYESLADNLVPNMPTKARGDNAPSLFVYDTVSGLTTLASLASDGEIANDFAINPDISSSGLVVAFQSAASNLISGIVASADAAGASFDVIFAMVDQCPNDPTKRAAGVCGCGVSDYDSDGDGAIDCQDACPTDEDKTAAGLCGCGVSDADDNGNGTADCLDPKLDTVPEAPSLIKKGKKLELTMQLFGEKVTYKYFIIATKTDKVLKSGNSSTNKVSLTLPNYKGSVAAYNIVSLGGIDSEQSPSSNSLKLKSAKVSSKDKKNKPKNKNKNKKNKKAKKGGRKTKK